MSEHKIRRDVPVANTFRDDRAEQAVAGAALNIHKPGRIGCGLKRGRQRIAGVGRQIQDGFAEAEAIRKENCQGFQATYRGLARAISEQSRTAVIGGAPCRRHRPNFSDDRQAVSVFRTSLSEARLF